MSHLVTVYHVTEKRNVKNILTKGLVPKIGPRSKSAKEKEPKIYAFPDMTSMEDGVTNWLGDEFIHRTSLLELSIPQEWLTHHDIRWEVTINRIVPPQHIKVLIDDMDA